MANGIATLGELHGVTLAKIKENAQKMATSAAKLEEPAMEKEEKKKEEEMEKIVPVLKTKNVDLDKIRQQAEQVRNFVTTVTEFMDNSFAKLNAIQAMSEEERELAEDLERQLEEEIESTMNVGVVSAKKAALTAYAVAKAKYCVITKETVLVLLDDLGKRGIIVKTSDNAAVLAWDDKYVIAPSLRQSARDIEKALINLISRARMLDRHKFETDKKALMEKTNAKISIKELFEGKIGRAGFDVRPMRVRTNQQNKYEEERILEGFVVVENDGNKITPIVGLGSIAPLISELRKKRITLSIHMLWRSFIPLMAEEEDPELFRCLIILHRLLKNGFGLANERSKSS